MKKLTEEQIEELRKYKYEPNGDVKYWDKMAEFYQDDFATIIKISNLKKICESIKMIPITFGSYDKTKKMYLDAVDDFNTQVGYTPEHHEEQEKHESKIVEEIEKLLKVFQK